MICYVAVPFKERKSDGAETEVVDVPVKPANGSSSA
jgi:hypothetical protein